VLELKANSNTKRGEIMTDKKCRTAIIAIIFICCAVMTVVDGIIVPDYHIKSLIKIIFFLGLPFTYFYFDRKADLKSLFVPRKKGIKLALLLCLPIYIIIVGAYLLFKDIFDFSSITASLTQNIGVNKDNFIYVSLYISFINSLLEEFFFRGFAFLTLKRYVGLKPAMAVSAVAFAVYHIAMMSGMFTPWIFALSFIGLLAGGVIFNLLNLKSESVYTSWFVHAFANFGINTVGFMLFGII